MLVLFALENPAAIHKNLHQDCTGYKRSFSFSGTRVSLLRSSLSLLLTSFASKNGSFLLPRVEGGMRGSARDTTHSVVQFVADVGNWNSWEVWKYRCNTRKNEAWHKIWHQRCVLYVCVALFCVFGLCQLLGCFACLVVLLVWLFKVFDRFGCFWLCLVVFGGVWLFFFVLVVQGCMFCSGCSGFKFVSGRTLVKFDTTLP